MNALNDLLAEVERHGGRLVLDGENLKVRALEPLPDELMDRLRQHKPELRRLLADQAARVLHTNYGAGYRHPDGRVETGAPEPAPRPAEPWPADLNGMLNRVATFFEWSPTDVRDFRQWARRSPEALAESRVFLEAEAAKLPAPGLSDRRRVVLDMLATDQSLRAAWTCADDGGDPVTLTLAVRGVGCCELAVPRARFDELALSLPFLVERLSR